MLYLPDNDNRLDTKSDATTPLPFKGCTLEARLAGLVASARGERVVFTTSFGMEDQAITHAILSQDLPIDIVTLDTGRMFEETYALWSETEARYGATITPYYPKAKAVSGFVRENGINGFYNSVANRKACCGVRKVEPLNRALEGAVIWITGIRADQNLSRANMTFTEADDARGLLKANPILDWDQPTLDAYIAEHAIPVNALHAKGFPSIGCAPCTRAVKPGEDPRAGRWWWENTSGAAGGECGLHRNADGKLVRAQPSSQPRQPAPIGASGGAPRKSYTLIG